MAKRKSAYPSPHGPAAKKRSGSKLNPANTAKLVGDDEEEKAEGMKSSFVEKLFDDDVREAYRSSYATSKPCVGFPLILFQILIHYRYKHGVIQPLISDSLLRSVRSEILANLHFSRKETDIYRIHQSGDLANLSGLPASALKLLPSLLQLRNALYSPRFRDYISHITNCGPLSGKKTDMAINVYMKGCHLLCHDDVIGSRRVSYILYLTDPDEAWKPQWGGALRLYPTMLMGDGKSSVPSAEWSKFIPPAWNQLSFFAVQPGESFHDVEEVFEEGKVRMAISGWFHIPQEGEEGYIEGEEERLAEQSSLQQLQSKADTYDLPRPNITYYGEPNDDDDPKITEDEDTGLTEADCDFLLKYISPSYLTPDTLEAINNELSTNFSIQLTSFLSNKYAAKLKAYIETRDGKTQDPAECEKEGWKVAVPPHKHRFLYLQDENGQQSSKENEKKGKGRQQAPEENPIRKLLTELFPSKPFQKLLHLATGLKILNHNVLARRFRRGLDYTLATGWEPDLTNTQEGDVMVEVCLGLTPSKGWEGVDEGDKQGSVEELKDVGSSKINGMLLGSVQASGEDAGIGGYEMYMAGDEEEEESDAGETKDQMFHPKKGKKSDPAIYRPAGNYEDDGILFTMGAVWNRLSIVLRDGGLLKFVKYVSRGAEGDRWDIVGSWCTINEEEDGEDDGDDDGEEMSEDEDGQGKNGSNGEEVESDAEGDTDGDDGEEWHGIQD